MNGYANKMRPLGLFSYTQAKQRCQDPNHVRYSLYGGRGIQFRFNSFNELLAEIGPRPAGWSIDRIDPNGHYEPGNVRWAPMTVQNRNKRNTKINERVIAEIRSLKAAGKKVQDLASQFEISTSSITRIIKNTHWFREEVRRAAD